MKKNQIIFVSLMVFILLLNIVINMSMAAEVYVAKTYIDEPVEGHQPIVKQQLNIKGWYMSNDENAQLKVYIDDEEQKIQEIVRTDRPDVINAINGYGGIEKNPQPGYNAIVDISLIKNDANKFSYTLSNICIN